MNVNEAVEWRYMVYNTMKKEYQFPSICETTEKGAITMLFKFIGNDARKHRFVIVRLRKETAKELQLELKIKQKANNLHERFLYNFDLDYCQKLIEENERRKKCQIG